MAKTRSTSKNKTIPFPASDLVYIEAIMRSKGMNFSGAVRYCVAQTRANSTENSRLKSIEEKLENLVPQIAALFADDDDAATQQVA